MLHDLTNIVQDTFVYGHIIAQQSVNMNFEGYKVQIAVFWKLPIPKITDMTTSYQNHYGISLFEYLRANLDLTKLDLD